MEYVISRKYIIGIIGVLSLTLFGLFWIRAIIPIMNPFLEWVITVVIILLEVAGIGLLIDWLLTREKQKRFAFQRQVLLFRIHGILQGHVLKRLKHIESLTSLIEQSQKLITSISQEMEKHDLPPMDEREKNQLSLIHFAESLFNFGRIVERGMDRISYLIPGLSEMFDPSFISDLILLTDSGYEFAEHIWTAKVFTSLIDTTGKATTEVRKPFFKYLSSLGTILGSIPFNEGLVEVKEQIEMFIEKKIMPEAKPWLREILLGQD
ncbi:MAG: hypothetical protein ACFFDP_07700 [Promethearchaeota archaeon]